MIAVRFLARRTVWAAVTYLLVAFIMYSALVLPTGAVFSPHRPPPAPETGHVADHEPAPPFFASFARWFAAVLGGRFGASPYGTGISSEDPLSLPPWNHLITPSTVLWSLLVIGSAVALALLTGTLLGALCGLRPRGSVAALHHWADRIFSAIPGYLWAVGLLVLVSLLFHDGRLGLRIEFLSTAYGRIADWPAPALSGAVGVVWKALLAWLILAVPYSLHVSQHVRKAAQGAAARGRRTLAHARGSSPESVFCRETVRPVLAAALSTVPAGMQLVLAGSLIGARVLGLPTFSRIFLYAFGFQTLRIVLSILMFYLTIYVVFRWLAEVAAFLLDPPARTRSPRQAYGQVQAARDSEPRRPRRSTVTG